MNASWLTGVNAACREKRCDSCPGIVYVAPGEPLGKCACPHHRGAS